MSESVDVTRTTDATSDTPHGVGGGTRIPFTLLGMLQQITRKSKTVYDTTSFDKLKAHRDLKASLDVSMKFPKNGVKTSFAEECIRYFKKAHLQVHSGEQRNDRWPRDPKSDTENKHRSVTPPAPFACTSLPARITHAARQAAVAL